MYQLNPASLDSENNISESKNLFKKVYNKTIKNKKNVNFSDSIDEPKNKITNINNLLSKIHENSEEDLDDSNNFQQDLTNDSSNIINNELNKLNESRQMNESNQMNENKQTDSNQSFNLNSALNTNHTNYDDGYSHSYDNLINNNNNINDNHALLSKLDYVIHLLEEQHNEKTTHLTEELILYLFLGIFIIFVLDSFARASKYVR